MANPDEFNTKWLRLQYACAVAYEQFAEEEIEQGICELLTGYAFEYCKHRDIKDWNQATLALQSTLSYVGCDRQPEEYDDFIDTLQDCISCAEDGGYDGSIDFENGLFPSENSEGEDNE